jgi:hypothetical protein
MMNNHGAFGHPPPPSNILSPSTATVVPIDHQQQYSDSSSHPHNNHNGHHSPNVSLISHNHGSLMSAGNEPSQLMDCGGWPGGGSGGGENFGGRSGGGGGKSVRVKSGQKQRRHRTLFTASELKELERAFLITQYPDCFQRLVWHILHK